ncbi:MAG: valine--tRNA ligase [Acidobacteria bacterium]|nr:valine--tRNA ligase [Acidobacteriota bacterium]NIM62900.1 valine--tRNA ligase [Acidobacteriota bacterium]NIO58843.1 valine--tRNA ligase [Acidobacteriota bacterium]NIQ29900.1 valine--tRNA ligase [Acidobacteriota bacterium]NIQ84624.1 valine--tRNA ligase [Acidobacteriota bacterium]
MPIDKEYLPGEVEARWIRRWAEADLFRADPDAGKDPFCMVIPPPNVTGNLHIGHVLVYTLHDVVARWRRMQGNDVLWLPGTDHAGIATQMVVERALRDEGTQRIELGREAFEKRVWEWKETYGNRITNALRTLGSSCDWSRERFTMDEGLSRAVRTVFVRLYDEGLIYRGRYIVNWCPRCHTAISDLETVYETELGALYKLRYPASDGGEPLELATTRPETLLGDTAVAVHPDDERYMERIGGRVVVPLVNREVPVIGDGMVDPEFGTGVVKITPGHDPNDFAAGQRHGLDEILVIGPDGRMTDKAGAAYAGLDRHVARVKVVADLEAAGLLLSVDEYEHAVGHCQRCGETVEPLVSRQWFVKVGPLAKPAIEAVERGATEFVPGSWSKVYFEWMRNIHDWCISRQLWWGHRIPAWYCDACDKTIVSEHDPDACECGGRLRQDEDVLDTWFSSALWPFSTMGWPDETRDLEHYYPTQLLITGHDIIFFWVARMMMTGLKFRGDVPFSKVYIHGLVRDAKGQKMSKSKGNTIDPHEVQEQYGTDAVRFTMSILAAPGNDIPLAPERMEGYRAFANKLWNATRFVLLKTGDAPPSAWDSEELTLADRWILSRFSANLEAVDRGLEGFRFDHAADALYHFVWGDFCDWYIELTKPSFQAAADARRTEVTRSVLLSILSGMLRMLHPIMPFITEELWEKLPGCEGFLATAPWPQRDAYANDAAAEAQMALLQQTVVKIRNLRAESGIDAGKRIAVLLHAEDDEVAAMLTAQRDLMATLVRAESIEIVEAIDDSLIAARGLAGAIHIALPLEGLLDLDAERERLGKDLAKIAKELDARNKKLANSFFTERAPAEVVEKERSLQKELASRKARLEKNLANLGST